MALGLPSTLPGGAPSVHESLRDLLASGGRSYSFEFFPPKDDASAEQLWTAIRRLEQAEPTFVSVTYGAGGTTQDRTVAITERIASETTLLPLAHLTCVGASVTQLRGVIGQYAAAGVKNVLALRGDPEPARSLVVDLAAIDSWLERWRARVTASPELHGDLKALLGPACIIS